MPRFHRGILFFAVTGSFSSQFRNMSICMQISVQHSLTRTTEPTFVTKSLHETVKRYLQAISHIANLVQLSYATSTVYLCIYLFIKVDVYICVFDLLYTSFFICHRFPEMRKATFVASMDLYVLLLVQLIYVALSWDSSLSLLWRGISDSPSLLWRVISEECNKKKHMWCGKKKKGNQKLGLQANIDDCFDIL